MKKIYKIILTLWISTGIGISGYFYIYPNTYRIYPKSPIERFKEESFGIQYEIGKEFELYLLGTIVGTIMIGGIGYSIGKDKSVN
jgi:hypothetical protein